MNENKLRLYATRPTGCSINIFFFPRILQKFATSPSLALGCYWLYKKLPANRSDCTLAFRWKLWRSQRCRRGRGSSELWKNTIFPAHPVPMRWCIQGRACDARSYQFSRLTSRFSRSKHVWGPFRKKINIQWSPCIFWYNMRWFKFLIYAHLAVIPVHIPATFGTQCPPGLYVTRDHFWLRAKRPLQITL